MEVIAQIERLRERRRIPLFAGEIWDPGVDSALRETKPEALFGGSPADPAMAAATLACLFIWNDDFNGSHNLCQGLDNPTGAFIHGICHRREGHRGKGLAENLSNARYWFRRCGAHPVSDPLLRSVTSFLEGSGSGFRWLTEAASQLHQARRWDALAMVDWVEQVESGVLSAGTMGVLEEIQWLEIDILTDWCLRKALGTG